MAGTRLCGEARFHREHHCAAPMDLKLYEIFAGRSAWAGEHKDERSVKHTPVARVMQRAQRGTARHG
ncbi:hypothetical protein J2X47_003094 [Sphingomonas sp. BE270]|nr:hypothetical protein [Sphingomonas sp. BE270]